jgi:hypothetical protein
MIRHPVNELKANHVLAVLFIIASFIPGSHAWLSTPSCWASASLATHTSVVILRMGSKRATKFEKKQEWMDKRGYSAEYVEPDVVPYAAIVGGGRIGGLLASAGNCDVLGRDDGIPADGEGPILVATRNDALEGIIDKCPENRRKDLVFMQNGYLDDFLQSKGLLDNTQVLLYLSVTARGADPVDGVTSVNPEGLTAAMGEWAEAFADRLDCLDLKCNVVGKEVYRAAMFEKLMWISTYMLVGTAKGCQTVGEAGRKYGDVVEQVVKEMVAAIGSKEGIQFSDGVVERLKAYTDVVDDFPCAVKEFEWRNKYFWDLGDDAVPTHNALLRECAEKDVLGFDLS